MRKFISTLMILALALSITSCAAGEPAKTALSSGQNPSGPAQTSESDTEADADASPEPPESAVVQVTYPVTVTDQLGRQVVIEKEPETLVSGYYISTSLLLALDCRDRLAGIEAKAKTRSLYRLCAPSVIDLPSVGSAKEFDLEGCAALNPDLVILPARLKDVIPTLEELGITVLAVNPESQELLEEAARLIGTATNTLPAADSLFQSARDSLSVLEDTLEDAKKPSVYLAGNSSFLSTAGSNMYQSTLIAQAGGINAAAELTDNYWTEISYEQLLAWNPDYIIAASDASYTVDTILNDPNLAECKAVKSGNVYQLPNAIESWDSPVPGSFVGSLWLASILHPDEYPDSQWKETATAFYETFYRFTPDLENLYVPPQEIKSNG